MDYRAYKDTNEKVSLLGMGCMRLPMGKNGKKVDFAKAESVIDLAVERGVNYFDSGYFYQDGGSERAMGLALKKYPRSSFFMTTKLPSFRVKNRNDILGVFEEQLERCQTDYFDFYLYHNVWETSYDAFTQGFVFDTLLELKEQGRIRRIGFSTHAGLETIERFASLRQWDIAQIQLNYLDWSYLNAKRQYEILTERGIPVVVMEPLRGGRFANTITPEADSLMKEYAPDRDTASWALRFAAGFPNVLTVLSGMNTTEQIDANSMTFSDFVPLSSEEQIIINKVVEMLINSVQVPCTGCRYCVDGCPAHLDIPRLIKIYNDYALSGHWVDILKLSSLPASKRPEQCSGCRTCTAHCPQKIDIPAAMEKLKKGAAVFAS